MVPGEQRFLEFHHAEVEPTMNQNPWVRTTVGKTVVRMTLLGSACTFVVYCGVQPEAAKLRPPRGRPDNQVPAGPTAPPAPSAFAPTNDPPKIHFRLAMEGDQGRGVLLAVSPELNLRIPLERSEDPFVCNWTLGGDLTNSPLHVAYLVGACGLNPSSSRIVVLGRRVTITGPLCGEMSLDIPGKQVVVLQPDIENGYRSSCEEQANPLFRTNRYVHQIGVVFRHIPPKTETGGRHVLDVRVPSLGVNVPVELGPAPLYLHVDYTRSTAMQARFNGNFLEADIIGGLLSITKSEKGVPWSLTYGGIPVRCGTRLRWHTFDILDPDWINVGNRCHNRCRIVADRCTHICYLNPDEGGVLQWHPSCMGPCLSRLDECKQRCDSRR